MTFRWLPDPEHYAHPRLAWLIEYLFDVVLGWMFRVEYDISGEPGVPPGALVMSNHLRDVDAPMVGKLLFQRRGLRLRGRLPYFAMREDLFQREGLANLLYASPWPLLRLLSWIPLRWLFANVRTLPMRRVREFTWHDTLRELVRTGRGGADPGRVFNARGQRELAGCLGALPSRVDAIDPWRLGRMRVARWGLRRLSPEAISTLAPAFRAVVEAQLKQFAARLDAGHSVYFAPEGGVSPDGRTGRIRAGAWRLPDMTATPPLIVFFVLSYDPLGPGRARLLVRRDALPTATVKRDPRNFSAAVRSILQRHRVVTLSHLLAWYLTAYPQDFHSRELLAWLQAACEMVREAGIHLDPLLERRRLPELVDTRLRWLRRKRLVQRVEGGWRNIWPAGTDPTWLHPSGRVRYLSHAFADIAPEVARRLTSP